MTAVVGILNKQAVALAADSAVTIAGAGKRKIFNRANKIFTLTKCHPVGVMIYSSASLMTTPWETLIKVYRQDIGTKRFPTLADYQKDFLRFLKFKDYFNSPEMQRAFAGNIFLDIVRMVAKEALDTMPDNIDPMAQQHVLEELMVRKVDELTGLWKAAQEVYPEFEDYPEEQYISYFGNYAHQLLINTGSPFGGNQALSEGLIRLFYFFLRVKEELIAHTGLIFAGFGENEIYPSLISLHVTFVFDNRLRYYLEESRTRHISNEGTEAAICPYAQTDVINTILSGVEPKLEETLVENFSKFFSKYNQDILGILGDGHPELAVQIQSLNIEQIVQAYVDRNPETKRNCI